MIHTLALASALGVVACCTAAFAYSGTTQEQAACRHRATGSNEASARPTARIYGVPVRCGIAVTDVSADLRFEGPHANQGRDLPVTALNALDRQRIRRSPRRASPSRCWRRSSRFRWDRAGRSGTHVRPWDASHFAGNADGTDLFPRALTRWRGTAGRSAHFASGEPESMIMPSPDPKPDQPQPPREPPEEPAHGPAEDPPRPPGEEPFPQPPEKPVHDPPPGPLVPGRPGDPGGQPPTMRG